MKLSYKIFCVYLLVSFILLILMMATLRFFAFRHFQEVEKRLEQETLTILSYELAIEYQRNNNWNRFKTSPEILNRFIRKALPGKPDDLPLSDPPGPPGPQRPNRPPGPPEHLVVKPHQRIALYDAAKILIAGPGFDIDKMIFKPITLHDQIVGWVGLYRQSGPPHPFRGPVLKEKLDVFYTIGIIIFILTGIVSYFLSRHILSPVNKLIQGTKALTRFKFDTRIDVHTKDELGQLAKDFNQMAKTLETYETMRKQWVVDISHELRTPLSILRGEIEAIQDGVRTFSREGMKSLHSETIYLETIVNDLHLLSMADTGALTMKTDIIKPIEILKTVLNLFNTRFEQEDLSLDVRLINEKTCIIGDKDRLKQLFSNIFENNLKYTRKPGKLTIWDNLHSHVLTIYIQDTGPGVPPGCVDKLFDRLYRVDRSRTREHGGSGLGLSICKTIALAHNGDIIAKNCDHGGLNISIQLPVSKKGSK
ncbi:MAG: HAMP domain-containing protein [Proteobacteria bacterium]|nr:HAMP domain-containing protein [Pseudomonadota bacterium]MBU1581974.1 HAMP domain-containing protein [Pseudomonadota bacterium]MBU2455883.1 HAMP domain-containing protein [Pseudomonadota bacterium]MBU2627423.1 HAMP domain-containing protein [Pseudomonadota bacterium]